MSWNIAQAKQRFSEVLKQAVEEPQVIYNRYQPVAVLIGAREFAQYEEWKRSHTNPKSMADGFAELRGLLQEEGFADGLEMPPRADRPNPFADMLEDNYRELPG